VATDEAVKRRDPDRGQSPESFVGPANIRKYEQALIVSADGWLRSRSGTWPSILRARPPDHRLFVEAVLASLPRARFLPAEAGGRKVRMWAVQSFVFEVR
jgi:hypothetical protein